MFYDKFHKHKETQFTALSFAHHNEHQSPWARPAYFNVFKRDDLHENSQRNKEGETFHVSRQTVLFFAIRN
jgi:hypothetical protein